MKNNVVCTDRSADRSSGREIATKSIKRVIALIFGLLLLINVQGLFAQTATAPSGTGTSGDPYLIATLNNLYWVTQNPAQWGINKYYRQTANIDASSTSTWSGGAGFTPIGNSTTQFRGDYDGQGFTILNLFIYQPYGQRVGLFGDVYSNVNIRNVGLVNVNIDGGSYVGALVGYIEGYGFVQNCYSTGSVSSTGGGSIIGGLIGYIFTQSIGNFEITIRKCYSTCNVSCSTGNALGGLIGQAISYSSYNAGPVIIDNCYAMGSVTGSSSTGGFIGGLADQHATNNQYRVQVSNCYSKGLVTASSSGGGFTGYGDAYPVTSCYWDTQTSGQASSPVGTGKTTVQMNTQSTFSGWDFSSTWGISAYNSGYPYLQYQPATPSINSVSPGGGVLAGGTTVVLTGYAFTAASSVKFGANNATSYTVNSANQITAVTPAGSLGQVNITVTTPIGTNSSDVNNHFTYFQGVIYVNASVSGGLNNGSSWTDAYTSLQTAMNSAFSSQQIWVAAGTYKPTSTTDRTISFVMKEGVAVYGGFAGTETQLTDRAPSVNVTILSGEIGAAGTTDNSYHVVQGPAYSSNTTTSILDGFTITAGYSNANGGGIYIYSNNTMQTVTISNCRITSNYASTSGGGVYVYISNASALLNCVVSGNTAYLNGGGIYTDNSNMAIVNLSIYGNTASNTTAANYGGGGGMYLYYGAPVINNTIITGNAVTNVSGYNNGGKQFYYYGNTGGSINYSCYSWANGDVNGGNTNFTLGSTNMITNPGFVNAAGGNFALYSTSPCIDAGDNTKNSLTTDIRGGIYGRKLLGTDHTQAGTIDIGAYEFYSGTDPVSPTIYVNYAATGSNNGTSWANAYTSLQTALNSSPFGYVWVAKGTYYPSSSYSMPNSPRFYHFEMIDGVQICGGFAGTETALSQRTDFGLGGANETILSGDIGTVGTATDNCYHVIYNPSYATTLLAVVDGLTITRAYADNYSYDTYTGGGISTNYSPITVNNCAITSNYAIHIGGGIYASSLNMTGCTVANNTTTYNGGGLNLTASESNLTNCLIYGNSGGSGGGINGSGTLTNCTLSKNTNTTSTAGSGGGGICTAGPMTLNNCIIYGNTTAAYGGDIFVTSGTTTLNYSCYSSAYTYSGSFVASNNNTTSNPQFVNGSTAPYDFRIYGSLSPCVDLGNNSYCSATTDIRGGTFGRKLNKTTGAAGTIDMGAYEYKFGSDPLAQLPLITSVAPSGGAATGGTTVIITGNYFTGATVVKFGANNATSFTVNSATQITATSPAGAVGTVHILITTANGTSTPITADQYTYFNAVIYVNTAATGANNGTTWTDAYTSLQSAFTASMAGQQIWVAAGTYKPTSTTDRTISFVMKEGVSIYGGFAGTETQLTDRSPSVNVTILSGEIGAAGTTDNSYHVVQGPAYSSNTTTSILDGFTITAGYSNANGGGVYIYSNNTMQTVTISNCRITSNYASTSGGGVYVYTSNASSLLNCVVSGNTAYASGGGIYTDYSNMAMVNLTIYGNTALNTPNSQYGGGGGIYSYYGGPVINNAIIVGNSANNTTGYSAGKQLYSNFTSGSSIDYSCYSNGANDVGGWNAGFNFGTHNMNTNPGFVNAAAGNFVLYSTSPCIDAGDNTKNSLTTDIRGGIYGRKLLGTDHTQAGTIDIGAYEFYSGTDPVSPTIYVNYAATGSNNGTSWANAYTSLQTALNNATFGYIWVAKGTYYPSSPYSLTNSPRYYHFEMIDGVQICGGFAGTETALSQRTDFGLGGANETILSGDIGTVGTLTDNCYHVFYHNNMTNPTTLFAVLDGFTITKAYADNGSVNYMNDGGGILSNYAITLNNCAITSNYAARLGGGISAGTNLNMTGCTVANNTAGSYQGGGIYLWVSSNNLTNCLIYGNSAAGGGGIYSNGVTLTNSTLSKNTNTSSTSGFGGGGIWCNNTNTINNCIIYGNSTVSYGQDIFVPGGTTTMNYSCFGSAYSSGSSSFNATNNCTNSNPQFVNTNIPYDFRIIGSSPCADAGNNTYNSLTTDIRGGTFGRKLLKTDYTQAGPIDMGAYEFNSSTDPANNCTNPTSGGTVAADQTICTSTAPAAFTSTALPSGHTGTLEYKWQVSTTSSSAGFSDIASSNSATYAPGTLSASTWYKRLARVTCATDWTGAVASNVLAVTVNPSGQVNQPADQVVCNGNSATAVTFGTTNVGGTTTYAWTNDTPGIGLLASGTGNIASFTAVNSGTSAVVATVVVTPTYTNGGTSCVGSTKTFSITVNPTGQVTQPADQVVCNGASSSVTFATTNTGGTTTYAWTNTTTSIGLAASGTGNIASFTATNTGTSAVVATIVVTPTYTNGAVGCAGSSKTFTITVNPSGQVNQPADQIVCNATSTTTVTFGTTNTGGTTTYAWTNNTPGIGLLASGSGNIASFTAVNTGTTPVVATIVVTPTFTNGSVGCAGPTKTFTITVNPTGQANQPANQVVCNTGATAAVTFGTTSTGGTTTYAWTNDTPGIGLLASGTGNIASFTAVNTGTSPVVATIVVTPTFTNGSAGCAGPTKTFTITVNPTGQVTQPVDQVVCNAASTSVNFASLNTGGATTYAWTNTTTSIGLAASGTGNISFTAANTGSAPVVATIVVTPTFTNGSVGCAGPTKTFTITVNPGGQVNQPADQVVCNTNSTTAVIFGTTSTGGTTTYTWTNDTPGIGLLASGTGNIASFTAVNTGTSPVVATIVVTPTYANGGSNCTGSTKTFTITVNPTGQVNQPASQVVCNATATATVSFGTTSTGGTTTYAWTNDTPGIGLLASGTGNIASFTAVNTGTSPVVATIVVTPTFTNGSVGCAGPTKTFTITVNPTGQLNQPADQLLCNGSSTTLVTFGTTNTGGATTYAWTNTTISIGLAASGTGNIASFTAVNTGTAPVIATIVVTPTFTNGSVGCAGPTKTFTITVNPTGQVNQPASQVLCNATATTAVIFGTTSTGGTTTYAWNNDTPGIGLLASGSGNIASFTAVNTGTSPVVATIVVTPTFTNGTVGCAGPTKTFTITVNPTGQVTQPVDQVVCNAASTSVTFATVNTGGATTYAWTNTTTSIGLAASGTGNIASFTAVNTGTSPVVATIVVTPTFTNGSVGCAGPTKTFTITVNPTGQVNQPASQVLCNATAATAVIFGTTNTGGTTTYAWTNNTPGIGLLASGTGNIASFIAVNTGTSPVVATIVVTPTFTNGSVGCAGPTKTFTITVNPTGQVNQPASQVLCNATPTAAVIFGTTSTGGTTTYAWTNDTPGIGLLASGTGNIASFIAVNTGTSPVVATIVVTPTFTNGSVGCAGPTKTFTITVNPTGQVTQPVDQVVCNTAATSVTFATVNTGGTTTYAWTNTNPGIGIAASGSGNISFNAINTGTSPVSASFTVTPTFTNGAVGCAGPSKTFTITVNPTGQLNQPSSQVLCHNTSTTAVVFGTINTGGTTTYAWTNNNPGIGLLASGTGNIASFTAVNTGTSPVVATIVVTPTFTNGSVGCAGPTKTFTITVNPLPVPTITGTTSMCANSGYYDYSTEANMTGYQWTVSSGGTITWGAGTNQIQVMWTTPGAQSVSVVYTNPYGCGTAAPTVLPVTVNPLPSSAGTITGLSTVCAGSTSVVYSVSPIANAAAYVWILPGGANIVSGSGTNTIMVNFAANAVSGTVSVMGNNLCGNGSASSMPLTVNPLPAAAGAVTGSASVCSGENGVAYSIASIAGATSYNWTLPAGASIASGTGTNAITVDFGSASGNITVTGSNACGTGTASAPLSVSVNPQPVTPTVTSAGYTLTSSAASGNQWYHDGTAIAGANSQTYTAPVTEPGWYWTEVTLLGCTSDTSNHVYIQGVGIDETTIGKFNIYPVPNKGSFSISIDITYNDVFTIALYNEFGSMIYHKTDLRVDGQAVIPVELFQAVPGMYTLTITGTQTRVIRKIVIKN